MTGELTSGDHAGGPANPDPADGEEILFDPDGRGRGDEPRRQRPRDACPAPQVRGPTWPVFSPDGTKIAWMNWLDFFENGNNFAPTLWRVADSDGSNQTSLGVLGTSCSTPALPCSPLRSPTSCRTAPASRPIQASSGRLNHRFRRVELSGATWMASSVTIEITGVTQDEPVRRRGDQSPTCGCTPAGRRRLPPRGARPAGQWADLFDRIPGLRRDGLLHRRCSSASTSVLAERRT